MCMYGLGYNLNQHKSGISGESYDLVLSGALFYMIDKDLIKTLVPCSEKITFGRTQVSVSTFKYEPISWESL